MEKEVQLSLIYSGRGSGARRGPDALYEEAKRLGFNEITRKDCQRFLRSRPEYAIFRPAHKIKRFNTILSHFPGDTLQADLMVMLNVATWNDGFAYLVLCYDSYSKFVASAPIKNKSAALVIDALSDIFQTLPFRVHNLFTDGESAIASRPCQIWLRELGIRQYTTSSPQKAPNVERMIRWLRIMLARYFKQTGRWRWLEEVERLMRIYNDRIHSTTKRRPWDVVSDGTLIIPHGHEAPKGRTPASALPPVGSYVRASRVNEKMHKEARHGNWTSEVYKVIGHDLGQNQPMAVLEDLLGERIRGSFYADTLQVVDWDPAAPKRVDEIHKKRTDKETGRKSCLVSYQGYPLNHREWIDEEVIRNLPDFADEFEPE